MNLRCLFGHKWGEPENVRMSFWEYAARVFARGRPDAEVPGFPKICDRTCLKCGKRKEGCRVG